MPDISETSIEIRPEGFENIELSLPINAAYITAARQTAFSVAGKLGFDAEETDDIKTAVSEACVYVIKRMSGRGGAYKITFSVSSDFIYIRLSCPQTAYAAASDRSLPLIESLMDEVEIRDKGGVFEIIMSKRRGG